MSLFQCREWWSRKLDTPEECDSGCMVVCDIDNAGDGCSKIVTGTFKGVLRIYAPKEQNFRAPDVRLEQDLGAPILQVAAGRFIPNSTQLGLAVLHPRALVVYAVRAGRSGFSEASTQDDIYYSLDRQYQHRLTRTACNMCYGPFGGARDRDSICVQSMDGQVAVFEQSSFAFARYLNSFLVPGPLEYAAAIDCIVTVNSAMHVDAYKYRTLGTSMGGRGDAKSDMVGLRASKKKIQVHWSYQFGEHARGVTSCRLSRALGKGDKDLLVVGEHTLLQLREDGECRDQSRLGYSPACFCAYPVGDGHRSNLLVATPNRTLMVYDDKKLLWSAQTPFVPVDVAVATLGGVKGMVVMLSEEGQVVVSYMGTEPMSQIANISTSRDLNYEAMDVEHKQLLAKIRQSEQSVLKEPPEKVVLRAQVPHALSRGCRIDNEDAAASGQGDTVAVSVQLTVTYTGPGTVDDVVLNFSTPEAILMESKTIKLPPVKGVGGGGRAGTPYVTTVTFFASRSIQPSSSRVEVVATYSGPKGGAKRTAFTSISIPLCLVCRVVPPNNSAAYAFTLETNKETPSLAVLFGDLFRPAAAGLPDAAAQANDRMTAQFYCGSDVTIRVSKSRLKCRLQSSCFEAMWLLTNQLVRRIVSYHSKMRKMAEAKRDAGDEKKQPSDGGKAPRPVPLRITYKDMLPLKDYFRLIDEHFNQRVVLMRLEATLEFTANQFRAVQRRLLVRFKHKNPAPLNNLDLLLRETFMRLNALADSVVACKQKLKAAASNLSCGTHLLLLLVRFKFGLDAKNAYLMEAFLSPVVDDTEKQGWEERTKASMMHLLRSVLVKSDRKKSGMMPGANVSMISDTTKLKRHIQLVCERLSKGYRLYQPMIRSSKSGGSR